MCQYEVLSLQNGEEKKHNQLQVIKLVPSVIIFIVNVYIGGKSSSRRKQRQKRSKSTGSYLVSETQDLGDLIYKRVQHLLDEPDGYTKWYYNRYDDGETETYNFPWLDDDPNLMWVDVWIIRFYRDGDGEVIWYTVYHHI